MTARRRSTTSSTHRKGEGKVGVGVPTAAVGLRAEAEESRRAGEEGAIRDLKRRCGRRGK
jgi:hypothetical protein